ncbi:MAG: type I restriction-modification enzyme R subunit C-terminal domain-containing protein [Verrucomicrobiota bacterium]
MKPEKQTRQEKIDIQLGRAGWAVDSRSLLQEYLVDSPAVVKVPETPFKGKKEFADYALPDRLGRVLAIVEAKRSSRHPLEGERQAADYADAIRAKTGIDPFIFHANGDEIWFWHRGMGPPRKVSGFFTEDQLRKAYDQPKATLADFLRHILRISELPSREALISEAFDQWVRQHPQLTATQLMFVRTLRKAVMQKAEVATLEALSQPPFTSIGDPESLFAKSELEDLLELTKSVAA